MAHKVIFQTIEEQIETHSPVNPSIKLHDTWLELFADNRMDRFRFVIHPDNPAYYFINEMVTECVITNADTNKVMFEGRILRRVGKDQGTPERAYWVEDVRGYLNDTKQSPVTFTGKPSELFKKIIERHNILADEQKQFGIGVCEVDTYRAYIDNDTPINVPLATGGYATIKPTAVYIWNNDNIQLRMADSVKGVRHTIETVGTGVFAGKYLLRHPIPAWGISGWVQASDIVEVQTPATPNQEGAITIPKEGYPRGTEVKIKKGVKHYYKSSDGTGLTEIRPPWNDRNYTTVNFVNGKYSIAWGGLVRAWANVSDLDFGAIAKPSEPIKGDKPNFVEKTRTIDADMTYRDSSWDAIKKYLLDPFGAELHMENVLGLRTLHIRNRTENHTDQVLTPNYNILKMQESLDPTGIITVLIPEGRLAKEEGA